MQGVEAIGEALRKCGATAVFCMLGGTNVAWMSHAQRNCNIDVFKCRHEESAVSGAMGYARVHGGVGYCTVTRGVGFANAINALICAVKVHAPVVMIVGESPSPNPVHTQNVAQKEICQLIGARFSHAENADEAVVAISEATVDARERGVPQVVSLGDGVITSDVTGDIPPPPHPRAERPSHARIREAIDLIAASENPLIVAGQGAVLGNVRDCLATLAQETGADVATSLVANRFWEGHPGELGISGGWATPLSYEHLKGHDLVLGVGASLNVFTTSRGEICKGARVIRVDAVDAEPSAPACADELLLEGGAGAVVPLLLDAWREGGHEPRTPRSRPSRAEQLQSVLDVDLPVDNNRGVDLRRALLRLDSLLPPDRIVATDSGRTVALTSALVGARDARSWVLGRGYGCVGQGLGVAIGAACAAPRRRVALFCGDGGFMMGISALDTARIHSLDNLVVVILNDVQYGSEVKYLKKYQMPLDIIQQSLPDIPSLARVYGGSGVVVEKDSQLDELTLPERGLFLVDVRIDPEVQFQKALAAPPTAVAI